MFLFQHSRSPSSQQGTTFGLRHCTSRGANSRHVQPDSRISSAQPPPPTQQNGDFTPRLGVSAVTSGMQPDESYYYPPRNPSVRVGRSQPADFGVCGGAPSKSQEREYSLQHFFPDRYSKGEEDFEFLRNLLLEAGETTPFPPGALYGPSSPRPAADAYAPPPPKVTPTAPPFLTPLWLQTQLVRPPLYYASSTAHVEAALPAPARTPMSASIRPNYYRPAGNENGSTGASLNPAHTVTYNANPKEQPELSDERAACIWAAGARLRKGLMALAEDTWTGASAAIESAAAIELKSRDPQFRQVSGKRLQAARRAVEADLRAVDDVAGANWDSTGPYDNGRLALLRGNMFTRLDPFKSENLGYATGEQDLWQRMNPTRTRVDLKSRVVAINEAAAATAGSRCVGVGSAARDGTDRFKGIGGEVVSEGADRINDDLEKQVEANHAAAEEERQPAWSESSGLELKEGILERLNATKLAAVAGKLNKESDEKNIVGSDGGGEYLSYVYSDPGVSSSSGDQQGGSSGGRGDGNASTGESAIANGRGQKRRRSGNIGRRCKRDGW